MKERGGSVSQYGTIHVTGNITPEMPRLLAREEAWRKLELIAKRKRDGEKNRTLTISFALSQFTDKNSL